MKSIRGIQILLAILFLLLVGGTVDVSAQSTTPWIPTQIPPRQNHVVAASADSAYLFGGVGEGSQTVTYFDDLWRWSKSDWQLVSSMDSGPSPRAESAMVFDVARNELLLYGGWNGVTELGDTWIWDGKDWQQPQISVAPPALRGHAMVYDAARGETILFGGRSGTAQGETWRWRDGQWEKVVTDVAPPPMTQHGMAYDFARERVVLFGGNRSGDLLDALWEWDGEAWHKVVLSDGPAPRAGHLLASAAEGVLLFGGQGADGRLSDTWRWNGSTWTRFAPLDRPAARKAAAGAYLSGRDAVLLFGGQNNRGYAADTWLWLDEHWQPVAEPAAPSTRNQHAMAYDATRDETVLFGGVVGFTSAADTWIWNGAAWQLRQPIHSPTQRFGHALVYDAAHERTVLFGGHDDYARNDLWTWDGVDWQSQHIHSEKFRTTSQEAEMGQNFSEKLHEDGVPAEQVEPRPRRRWGHAMVYDPAREEVVLFGGSRDEAGFYSDTWILDGTQWTERTDEVRPSPRRDHAMIYDAAANQVLLFGGYHVDGDTATYYDDTWAWRDGSWRKLEVDNPPPGRFGHTLVYDPQREQILLIGGSGDPAANDRAAMDVVWAWSDGAWQELSEQVPVLGATQHAATTHGACQVVLNGGLNAMNSPTGTWLIQAAGCQSIEPSHEETGSEEPEVTEPENADSPTWTMMLYLAGDTVMFDQGIVHTHLQRALSRMEKATVAASEDAAKPTVNVIALIDGPESGDTELITFTPEATVTPVGEKAMDAPATLLEFVQDAKAQFPADYYYLAITDHANGIEGIAWDNTSDPSGDALLTPSEIRQALRAATNDGADPIDVLHYDGCSFGLLENASIAHGFVDYVVASQNTGWGAFTYERYYESIDISSTPLDFATAVVNEYGAKVVSKDKPYTLSVLDLRHFDSAMVAFNEFTAALQTFVDQSQSNLELINEIRNQTQLFDSDGDLRLTQEDDYIDLVDFARRVQAVGDSAVVDTAETLIDRVVGAEGLVAYEGHQSGTFEYYATPYEWDLSGANGVGIYYPSMAKQGDVKAYVEGSAFPYFHSRSTWHSLLNSSMSVLSGESTTKADLPPLAHLWLPENSTVHLPIVMNRN